MEMCEYEELALCLYNDGEGHKLFSEYLIQCARLNSAWTEGLAEKKLTFIAKKCGYDSMVRSLDYTDRLAAAQVLRDYLAESVAYELRPDLSTECLMELRETIIKDPHNALMRFEEFLTENSLTGLESQITDHIAKANNHLTNANRKYQEALMNKVPFKTVNYVFGQDIKDMSEDQLLDAIRTVEKEIESYASIKVESKKVEKRKEELDAALKQIVEALDAK